MIKATTKWMASLFLVTFLAVGFTANSFAQYTFTGDDVIIGGEFAGDSIGSEWGPYIHTDGGASADISASTGEVAITNLAGLDGTPWYIQFNQVLSDAQIADLKVGEVYELTFDARTETDSTRNLVVFFGQNGGGWVNYATGVELTGTMQTFTQEFELTEKWDNTTEGMKLGFEMGESDLNTYLDNISLVRKSENLLEDGEMVVGDTLSSRWITEGGATFSADNGTYKISNIPANIASYEVQIRQELTTEQIDSVYPGPYTFSFDAKTSADAKTIQAFFGNNGTDGDWTNFAPTVELTNEMKHYELKVEATQNWTSMKVGFEVAQDTASVWFDNVVLKRVREVPPASPDFTLSTTDGVVTITVTPVENAATYDVFFSNSVIDTTNKAGVSFIGTVDAESGLSLTHTTKAPHESLISEFEAHYGVVAKSEAGAASEPTSKSIMTSMSVAENYAAELGADAVNAVATAMLETGEIPASADLAAFFPESYVPFTISPEEGVDVVATIEGGADDLTSKHWIGFAPTEGYLVIYAEVMDDSVKFATESDGSGGAWNFDSWEMGIGNYSPESFITGSDHSSYEGGAEPDWQLRGGGIVDAAGDGSTRGFIHGYGILEGRLNGEIPNSQTLVERTSYGWRSLTLITTVELSGGGTSDAEWVFPSGSEVKTFPIQIAMNDNDAATRQTQKAWGSAAVNGDWWQRPAQWNVIAFVGADALPTSIDEDLSQPMKFSLEQNYPNPFNPSTNINFTLPSASKVTLEVYNMLGQKVATLVDNESLAAGVHNKVFDASKLASGMYIYRITAGNNFSKSQKMMLIK